MTLFLILVVGVLAVAALTRISALRRDVVHLNDRFGRMDRRIADLTSKLRSSKIEGESSERQEGAEEKPQAAWRLRSRPEQHVASKVRTIDAPVKDDVPAAAESGTDEQKPVGAEASSQHTGERDAIESAEAAVKALSGDPDKPESEPQPAAGESLDGTAGRQAKEPVTGAGRPRISLNGTGKADQTTGKEGKKEKAAGGKGDAAKGGKGIGFEAKLGTVWTMRVGLVLLAIAVAYYARAVVPTLPPLAKVLLAYAGCAVLFGVGKVFERKLTNFAKPVMACGLALGFFVSYAAYFVTPMRAVSLPVSLVWMTLGVVAVLVFAERWRSQRMAALVIVLGHVSAFVAAGSADRYSLGVITALSILAVWLLIRHGWVELTLFAVVSAYGSHMLWSLAEHPVTTAERAFWVNIAFFASYYVTFLVADLVWWRRLTKDPNWECRRFEGLSGRLIGPVNVTLFLFVAAYLYVRTDVYFTGIHWFFFVLAAVQEVHARYLKILGNDDYVLYSAVGTILVALGFFSAFEALSLSVALAAEALVLLIIAHRTRVWLFHLLAQAALLANFIHSWWYEGGTTASVTVFLGAVAVTAVYMVMSWLEDRWYGRDGDPDWDVPSFSDKLPFGSASRYVAEKFDDVYSAVTPYLSFFHAGAGSLILIQQADRLLAVPHALLALSIAVLLLLTVALWLRSLPFLVGCLVLQFGVAYMGYTGNPGPYWISWAVLTAGFAGALVLVTLVPSRMREFSDKTAAILVSHGLGWGVLVAMPWALVHVSWEGVLGLTWIVTLGLLFWHQDRVSVNADRLEVEGDSVGILDKASGVIACVIGAIVIVPWTVMVAEGWDINPDFAVPSLLTLWAGILIAVAGYRDRIRLYVGGATILLVCYMLITNLYLGLPNSAWATVWVVAVTCGIAVAQDYRLTSASPGAKLRYPFIVATYIAYAMGLGLLLALFDAKIGFPWSVVAMAVLPFALITLTWRLGAERAAWVALISLFAMHLVLWVGLFGDIAAAGNDLLVPALILTIMTIGFERVLTTKARLPMNTEQSDPNPAARLLLIVSVIAVAMVVIYESQLLAGWLLTSSWSIVGAALMVLGFLWKSASYRRVALGVFGACLIRVFLVDIRSLPDEHKPLAIGALAVCLIVVAWLYSRFSGEFKKWL